MVLSIKWTNFCSASHHLIDIGCVCNDAEYKDEQSRDCWLPATASPSYRFSWEGSSHLKTNLPHPPPLTPGQQALTCAPSAVCTVSEARLTRLPEPSCSGSEMFQNSRCLPLSPSFSFKILTQKPTG